MFAWRGSRARAVTDQRKPSHRGKLARRKRHALASARLKYAWLTRHRRWRSDVSAGTCEHQGCPLIGVNRKGPAHGQSDAIDPNVWSGRALQEVFVDPADTVLRQCIRPLLGARCAPGHHGYQRACDLISGQASTGPFGSPVFACAGKTDPPSSSYPLADLGG